MKFILRLTLVTSLAAISGCATIQSGSFVDRTVDFSRYRTYAWAPKASVAGDPRLEKNPYFQDYLYGSVEREFAAKGFKGPTPRRPDLLIRYRAAVTPRVSVNGVENGYGYCSDDCTARINEYETATLVLDLVDARNKKVVWRGWAQDRLDDVLDNQDRMKQRLQQAVTAMLARFPAKA